MATKKPKQKKKNTRSKAAQGTLRPQIVLAGIILTVLAALALFLTRGPQTGEPPADIAAVHVVDELAVEIDSLLLRNGLSLAQVDRVREPGLLRYEVRGPALKAPAFSQFLVRLRHRFGNEMEEQRQSENLEVTYYWRGALIAVLKFEPAERLPVLPPPVRKPRLAIIMDDLGRSLSTPRTLVKLDLHVTMAILPGEPLASEVAALAHREQQEAMLHLPMEPHDYPQINPGDDALLLGQGPSEVRSRLMQMLANVPTVVGANNHMGSRFTEYPDGMEIVMAVMREQGLFFVDSRTSSRSVAAKVAQQAGVPVALRDVFLDNVSEVDAIRTQIRKLLRLAKRQGHAVGICHPYPETLEALRQEQAALKDGGVELVFASQLVQ